MYDGLLRCRAHRMRRQSQPDVAVWMDAYASVHLCRKRLRDNTGWTSKKVRCCRHRHI